MKKLLLASIGAIALISSAHAQNHDWSWMGAGVHSCAQFAKEYRRQPGLTESVYFTWAQGYMSAVNTMLLDTPIKPKNLAGRSTEDQELSLRSYCDQHPLAQYREAVEYTFTLLPDSKINFKQDKSDE